MASYLMLSTLTDEGRKTLKQRPDRLSEVNKEVEAMGGRIHSQYAVLGAFDFVTIIDAPSNEIIARISVELGSRGTVSVVTYPVLAVSGFTDLLRDPSNGQG